MFKYRYILSLLIGFVFSAKAMSQMYVFAQLQGSPVMNTTGWNLTGAAAIGDTPGDVDGFSNELILIPPVNTTSGGVFYAEAINPGLCQKWTVDFDFRIYDGSAADGIAFCFLQVPPTGFVVGGGVGIPGTANGLKVVFDTYDNGCGANPEIQVYSGVGYNECISGIVKVNNTGGNLDFIRSNDYNAARITYDNGNISVIVNGTTWISNAYFPINFSGYMGFTSGSGAQNDRHSIRNVTIYTEQAPSNAGPNVAYCSGGSAQIGTASNPLFTYSWFPTTGLDQANISNPTVSLTNSGSVPITQQYIVTTTLTANSGSCPNYDTVVVTINPVPTANFTLSNTQGCVGQPVTITYTGNMNGAATFTWNFNGGTVVSGSGIGPYQVSWPTGGAKQVTLAVSKYGCTSTTETQNITIYSLPTSTFTKPVETCEESEITITYTGTGTSAANYNWDFDGGTVVSGTNEGPYQINWPSAGLKNIKLIVTENGCISPTTQDTVRVHAIPVAQLIVPSDMCSGDTILVGFAGDTASTATTFSHWTGGTVIPIVDHPAMGYNWTSGTSGAYTFSFTINRYGCQSDTVFKSVNVHSIPTATFTATPEVCLGQNTTLTYTGTGSSTANYAWNYSPATLQAGYGQGPLDIQYAADGNYNISLTVTENNCVSPAETVSVIVHSIPTSTFNVASGICVGQTSPLTYTGTGSATATFDWNFDGVQVISGSGIGPYVLGDANLGTFDISLQVTENGCISPVTTHEFLVLPTPSVNFSGTPLIGCNPLSVTFTNLTSTQPGMVYAWSFGDSGNSSQENPTHIYVDAGSFTVTLTATNGYGCSSSETKPGYVNVTAQPVAGFSVLPEKVTMDNPTVKIVDNSQFAQTYSYSMGDGTYYSQPQPTHSYASEGEYEVTQVVTNSLGCMDKATIIVTVSPYTNVFIPNTFSPTGDGINDTWNPIISYITKYQLRIYDRWGLLVYQTDDIYEGWNGNYYNVGKAMAGGQYVYKINFTELSGKTRDLLGNIILLR